MRLLSHYTTRAGLLGIAQSKTLWATRFSQVNDTREIEYGFVEIMMRALRFTMSEIDKALGAGAYRRPINDAEAMQKLANHFRQSFVGETGSEPSYVFSFATSQIEDHQNRGLLTLWDRYTRLEGYCLQFDQAEVRQVLKLEATSRNYALLDLADVKYGIDEADLEYLTLRHQLLQLLLIEVQRGVPGIKVEPKYDDLWPMTTIATRMMSYIAKHKDPFFLDERETRIIALPANEADSRFLTGPAWRKQVKTKQDGKQYIDLGEDWRPGIEPLRILVGPKASRDLDEILVLFDRKPQVLAVDFPIQV